MSYHIHGGLSGADNPAADQTTRPERFSECVQGREAALARARALAAQLRPGGIVVVDLDGNPNDPDVFGDFCAWPIAVAQVLLDGQRWSDPFGLELF